MKTNVTAAMERFCKAEAEYKKIFGEHSLDRVVLHNPTWLDADNFDEAAKLLTEAVQKKQPFEPISDEMYKNMIF